MASVRLTLTQEKEIAQLNVNKSDFIRKAVDYYLIYLKDPYNNVLLADLERWIEDKKCSTSVVQCSTSVTHCNTNNTSVTQKSTDVTQKPTQNNLKHILKNELQMLQRLLNNPENLDTIPDYTLKTLSKRYDLSKSSIQGWIVENKNWLKHTDFTENKD